jgi:hypothetical protein
MPSMTSPMPWAESSPNRPFRNMSGATPCRVPPSLNRLADALNVKAMQLWSEPQLFVRFIAYRKRSTLPKKSRTAIQALVEEKLEERTLLQDFRFSSVHLMYQSSGFAVASEDDAEAVAGKVRDLWKLGVDPIANLTAVLEDHLVHVIEVDVPEKFDGISAVGENEAGKRMAAAVVSRSNCPGDRQRLSPAHELALLVMKPARNVDEEKAAFRFAGVSSLRNLLLSVRWATS